MTETTSIQMMTIAEIEDRFSELVDHVARHETRVLVAESGVLVAGLVPAVDIERLARIDEQRARRRRMLDAMREPFHGVSAAEIERETARAVAEVRADMRAEREATRKAG